MSSNRLEVIQNQCQGGSQQTFTCGGTADVLPKERAKASFNVEVMTNVFDGGKKFTARKRFIRSPIKNVDFSRLYGLDRSELLKEHVKEFIRIHKQFPNYQPTKKDINFMAEAGLRGGSLNNHMGLFIMTILAQADEEQKKWWARKAVNFQIVGNYCQTELGHGSNIRAIQSTAHYDKATQQFILNTPTLQSYKWWPGCLAKVSTHAVFMAQLIIDDKEYGLHAFMLQIRDENHKPLPGIELGDLGQKIGDDMNDTGYMAVKNVRIPREYMLAQYQTVTPDGQYLEKNKVNKKTLYATMLYARAQMIFTSASRLAVACIIATRYSCVRKQGFLETSNTAFKSEERQIIDYQIQQYRIFKQIAITIAMKFAGIWMNQRLVEIEGDAMGGQLLVSKEFKEIAAFSAGLKSLCTFLTTEGVEDLRKSCGGNGYLLSSGIAQVGSDFLWQVTAEGDFIILQLLTAKFLLKSITQVMGGKQQKGSLSYLNVLLEPEFAIEKCMPKQAKAASEYTNPAYLASWFKFRALAKIINAGKSMQGKMMEQGLALDEAWNESSLDLLAATQAHSYHILMENFANQVEKVKDEKVKNVLNKLCILFGCTQILDGQWTGILPSSQMPLIKETAYKMMKEIRPECIAIVDAFDIPDNILASTIGRSDGNVYEALYDAAKKSQLNKVDPFDGYEQYLKPHLNIDFLKLKNSVIPQKHNDALIQHQSKL